MIPDLRQTKAILVVFAMHGCGACDTFLPVLMERLDAHNARGATFRVWSPGETLAPGMIPVLFYDAASGNDQLQNLADRLGVTATPSTYLLTRTGTFKTEGSMTPEAIDKLLVSARNANH